MSDQLSLDDLPTGPAARPTDPATSAAAAADAKVSAGSMRLAVLTWLDRAQEHGMTDFELADATGRQQTSIGKRRGELRDAGLVGDSGRTRPSPSGSKAVVWTITDLGRARLQVVGNHPSAGAA